MLSLTPVELETLADTIADKVADRLANRRRLYTRVELSVAIGVSVAKIDTMLRDGELPVIRIGRKVLFDVPTVLDHLATKTQETMR